MKFATALTSIAAITNAWGLSKPNFSFSTVGPDSSYSLMREYAGT